MQIRLSPIQETAIDLIVKWWRSPTSDQIFTLGGFAGTGKTTIMEATIEALDSNVRCCAPTGKAVSVLQSKLPEGVPISTIHSFLYQPVEINLAMVVSAEHQANKLEFMADEDSTFRPEAKAARARATELSDILDAGGCLFRDRDEEKFAPLMIVDECSMVDDEMERDLRAHAGKILFVGDPAQLAPINGTDFFVRNQPDFVLDEVHRQALDSTVLRLATFIRSSDQTKKFQDWNDTDCRILRGGMSTEELTEGDVVITGKNVTRMDLNERLRGHYGHTSVFPEKGEMMMCLRNEHGRGLINGVGGIAASDTKMDAFGYPRIDLAYGGEVIKDLQFDAFNFEKYQDPKLDRRARPPKGAQFDFGYAMTCHKSQGSEWDNVVVWDDRMRVNDKANRKRWTYTAVTRAAKTLTWVVG